MLGFDEGGKPEKNPRGREENQHKLNPLMAFGPGIEPGPHWWEASALTTAPSPNMSKRSIQLKPVILTLQLFFKLYFKTILINMSAISQGTLLYQNNKL